MGVVGTVYQPRHVSIRIASRTAATATTVTGFFINEWITGPAGTQFPHGSFFWAACSPSIQDPSRVGRPYKNAKKATPYFEAQQATRRVYDRSCAIDAGPKSRHALFSAPYLSIFAVRRRTCCLFSAFLDSCAIIRRFRCTLCTHDRRKHVSRHPVRRRHGRSWRWRQRRLLDSPEEWPEIQPDSGAIAPALENTAVHPACIFPSLAATAASEP